MTLDDVDAFIRTLPEVVVGARWNNPTWLIHERGFAWPRALRQSDIERLGEARIPQGEILAVMVENLDAKDALLSMGLPGFFTIQHFNNFPAVLIELKKARPKDVRLAVSEAYRITAAKPPKKAPGKRSTKASKPRAKKPARARKARSAR